MAPVPVTDPHPTKLPETLEARFQRLAAAWHQAVAHHSSSRVRYGHPAYREIIDLGTAVVPFLLRDLEDTGRHWYEALHAITGAQPVSEADAGKIGRMKEAWLHWGREHGYQW
jgi:hypothetical protein